MTDVKNLLVELFVEELPPKALKKLGEAFASGLATALQAQGLDNLRLAGRVTGADTQAYGSLRVMGTAFATGHAAGVSAALWVQGGGGGEPPASAVQEELRRQGALI